MQMGAKVSFAMNWDIDIIWQHNLMRMTLLDSRSH